MAQYVGHRLLGDSKGGNRHVFGDAAQALAALQAPVHVGVFKGAQQMCAQAGFQAQAGQLPWVEDGRDIANIGQGVVQGAAQGAAVLL
ncbi:hypothetical protein D3C85_1618060 [compost metagenome]